MKTQDPVKRIPANCARTRLERNALHWMNDAEGYDNGAQGRFDDLEYGGCRSGMVGHLIYSVDCRKFLKYHRAEINEMLGAMLEDNGCDSPADLLREWDASDPLGMDVNADRLAWFGFETACRNVMDRARDNTSEA